MAKIMLLSHLLGYPVRSYKFGRLADGKRSNGVEKKHVYCFKSDYERNSPRHKGLNEDLF